MHRSATGLVPFCLFTSLAVSLAACVKREPADLTLEQLASQQTDYVGREVQVTGTLRSHDDPLHFWIEDSRFHRVALRHGTSLERREGECLVVRGIFRYAEDRGRAIEVQEISPAPLDDLCRQ